MGQPAQYPDLSDKGVVGLIMQELDGAAAGSWVSRIANQFPSNQASETYAGVGNVGAMREWIGEKLIKSLEQYKITIDNKDWESTLKIFRKDLRRDKTAQLVMRAAELAVRATEHDAKRLSELIDTGDDADIAKAFDGQFFFDTDHAIGASGTINNDITFDVTTTTDPTATEAAKAILKGIQQIYGFKDDAGEPSNQNHRAFLIMVPNAFWASFATALTKENLASAADNPLLGLGFQLELVQNPRLTWTDKFAVFVTDTPAKPFIVQIENGPTVEVLGEGSDYAFHNAAHLFSVIKAGNANYARFDKACLVTLV